MIQWKSVKDGLPEKGKLCVIKLYCSNELRFSMIHDEEIQTATGNRIFYPHWLNQGTLMVTHWIELPDFPTDEQWAKEWYKHGETLWI